MAALRQLLSWLPLPLAPSFTSASRHRASPSKLARRSGQRFPSSYDLESTALWRFRKLERVYTITGKLATFRLEFPTSVGTHIASR